MSDNGKIQTSHLQRRAYIYVRQSTAAQVACNRESTDRQYKLRDRALRLGWPEGQVMIVDEDLAQSGAGTAQPRIRPDDLRGCLGTRGVDPLH